jgi:hypothetical protein
LRTCCLILWPLRPFFMCLRAFVFDPDCDSLFQCFSGTTWFTGSQKLVAYFKENVSISSFPICQKGCVFGLVDKFCHGLDGFFEKGPILFAAAHFPRVLLATPIILQVAFRGNPSVRAFMTLQILLVDVLMPSKNAFFVS